MYADFIKLTRDIKKREPNTNESMETDNTKILKICTVSSIWDTTQTYDSLSDEFICDLDTSTGYIVVTGKKLITIDVINHYKLPLTMSIVKVEYDGITHVYEVRDESRTFKDDVKQCIIDGVKHHIEYIEKHNFKQRLIHEKMVNTFKSITGMYIDTDNVKPCIIQIRRFNKFFEYDCLKAYSNGFTNLKNDVDEETAFLINNDYVCSNHSFDEKNDIDIYVYVPRETGETKWNRIYNI